jgi:UDP-GlcNAc:undecaprenyl-phosphate GlcNAc-1-phosphate transferase
MGTPSSRHTTFAAVPPSLFLPLAAFLLALLLSALLTPRSRHWAAALGALDRGDAGRAVHEGSVPRVGGLAIALAFFAPLLALVGLRTGSGRVLLADAGRVLAVFGGGTAVLLLGLLDDMRPMPARRKLLAQLAVATVVAWLGVRFDRLELPWLGVLGVDALSVPLTVLWLVGIMNAINLVDGLDGLAAGLSLLIVAALLIVSVRNGESVGILIGCALAGALVGFLRHNFHPASLFMGDSGSLFLGFMLGAWSIFAWQKTETGVVVGAVLLLFALPLADTGFAVIRRALAGRSVLEADAGHIHHRLLRTGLSHRYSVMLLYAAALLSTALALAMLYVRP